MLIDLTHKNFRVFLSSTDLLDECYQITKELPQDERFILVQQIRRAALSVMLNIAEGSSRKSAQEKKRFYEIARSSVVEVDTAFTACLRLHYFEAERLTQLSILLNNCFKMLSKMISVMSQFAKNK